MDPALLTVVGHCTADSARILCVAEPGAAGAPQLARIAWRSGLAEGWADAPLVAGAPLATGVFQLTGLPPGGRVEYAVVVVSGGDPPPTPDVIRAHQPLRVLKLPPADRAPRIALLSCNGYSEVSDPAERYTMWTRLRTAIERGEVDLVIHAGDQVYADKLVAEHQGEGFGVLVEGYRRLYLEAWSAPEVAGVLASVPNLMMWDDHDICDGWGSNESDPTPARRPVLHAARQAFAELQASHNPPSIDPGSFASAGIWGPVAVLLVDARSHRCYDASVLLGEAQRERIRGWLAGLPRTVARVFVVVGTPPVHAAVLRVAQVPRWMRLYEDLGSDFRDAWVSPNNQAECAAFMGVLREFLVARPDADLTILAGDVHVGTVGSIELGPEGPTVWQVTSSGISTPPPDVVASAILKRVTRAPVELGEGASGQLLPVMPDDLEILLRRNYAILATGPDRRLDVQFVAEELEEPLRFSLPTRGSASRAD